MSKVLQSSLLAIMAASIFSACTSTTHEIEVNDYNCLGLLPEHNTKIHEVFTTLTPNIDVVSDKALFEKKCKKGSFGPYSIEYLMMINTSLRCKLSFDDKCHNELGKHIEGIVGVWKLKATRLNKDEI